MTNPYDKFTENANPYDKFTESANPYAKFADGGSELPPEKEASGNLVTDVPKMLVRGIAQIPEAIADPIQTAIGYGAQAVDTALGNDKEVGPVEANVNFTGGEIRNATTRALKDKVAEALPYSQGTQDAQQELSQSLADISADKSKSTTDRILESAKAGVLNPRGALPSVAESAPQFVAGGAALKAAGVGANALTAAQKSAAAYKQSVAVNGLLEGTGGSQGAREDIERAPIETLRKQPAFQELEAQYGEEQARKIAAEQAGSSAYLPAGFLGAAASAVTGGGAETALLGKLVNGTRGVVEPGVKGALKYAAKEAAPALAKESVEEGLQGASGQFSQNLAEQPYTGVALGENVAEQVGVGAATGLLAGGGYSAVGTAHDLIKNKPNVAEEPTVAPPPVPDALSSFDQPTHDRLSDYAAKWGGRTPNSYSKPLNEALAAAGVDPTNKSAADAFTEMKAKLAAPTVAQRIDAETAAIVEAVAPDGKPGVTGKAIMAGARDIATQNVERDFVEKPILRSDGSAYPTEKEANDAIVRINGLAPSTHTTVQVPGGFAPVHNDVIDQYELPIAEETPIDAAIAKEHPLHEGNDYQASERPEDNKKAVVNFQDLPIAIENPTGSERTGTGADGKAWSTTMQDHYGEILAGNGADGDAVDVFIPSGLTRSQIDSVDTAFIVDQIDPKTGLFDEHKIILAPTDAKGAEEIYRRNYDKNWAGLGAMTAMPIADFKIWLKNPEAIKKPVHAEVRTSENGVDSQEQPIETARKTLLSFVPDGNINSLTGPQNVGIRQQLIQHLLGLANPPAKTRSTITSLRAVFYEQAGIQNDTAAGMAAQFKEWATGTPARAAQAPKPKVDPAKRNKTIRVSDTGLTAIAKLGGINREAARKDGIDPAYFQKRIGILYVFKENGGLGFDQMAEELRGIGYDVPDANALVELVDNSVNHGVEFYTTAGTEAVTQLAIEENYSEEEAQFAYDVESLLLAAKAFDQELYEGLDSLANSGSITQKNIDGFWRELNGYIEAESAGNSTADGGESEEFLTDYTTEGLTDRAAEQERLKKQAAAAELKAKQKEQADKEVDTLADEMLGNFDSGSVFDAPPFSIPTLLAPNGKPSNLNAVQHKQVRTPEFKKWFGDWENDPENASKVVDENGEPLVVYHGTKKDFTEFKSTDKGIYFAEDDNISERYTSDESGLLSVYLNSKNHLDATSEISESVFNKIEKTLWEEDGADEILIGPDGRESLYELAKWGNLIIAGHDVQNQVIREIGRLGYTGVKINDFHGGERNEIVDIVFNSNQIKSATGNNGEFSSENNDIRFSIPTQEDTLKPLTPEQAENHLVSFFGEGVRRLIAANILNFTQGKASWPEAARNEAAEAYYDPATKRAYVDLRATSEDRLGPVVLHEIGEHFGLRKMLGSAGYASLQGQIKSRAAMSGSRESQVWAQVAKAYQHLTPGSESFIAEVVAKLGETNPNAPWYRRLITQIKAFLMKYGLARGFIAGTITPDEIHTLLSASLRSAAQTSRKPRAYRGGLQPAFSMEEAKRSGYEGSDTGEAEEWLRAKAKGLDMSQEGRMARAKAMGFDTTKVLFRGTNSNEKNAGNDNGWMYLTDSSDTAGYHAKKSSFDMQNMTYTGANIMPLYVKPEATYFDKMIGMERPAIVINDYGTAKEYIVKNPSAVRSIFAAFDPDFKDSGNLMASLMYRGTHEASSKTGDIVWMTPDEAHAKGYGDVSTHEFEPAAVFNAGRDANVMTPQEFSAKALDQTAVTDRTVALGARATFLKGFSPESRNVTWFWISDETKKITADFLQELGFDSIKLDEDGVETFGVIRPSREFSEPQFSIRTEPAPTKTITAYKLFRIKKSKPGQLFPLFVKMGEDRSVPIGVWEDAEVGGQITEGKKAGKVKSSLGGLAFRPGWHMGEAPASFHIGGNADKQNKNKPTTRPNDQVWAEVEVSADKDWQEEANSRASYSKKTGEIVPGTAHLTDRLPTDGFYRYKTNANMVGKWIIAGSMKITRVLTDAEVSKINRDLGSAQDLPRETPLDLEKAGFPSGNSLAFSIPTPDDRAAGIGANVVTSLNRFMDDILSQRWAFLSVLQMIDRVQKFLPGAKAYGDHLRARQVVKEDWYRASDQLTNRWKQLTAPVKVALNKLMQDSTLSDVDAAQAWSGVTPTDTGSFRAYSQAKYTKTSRAFLSALSGAPFNKEAVFTTQAEADYFLSQLTRLEQKQAAVRGRVSANIARAKEHTRLQQEFAAVPEAAQKVYKDAHTLLNELADAKFAALIQRIEDSIMDGSKRAVMIQELRKNMETGKLQWYYAPLQRFGKYWFYGKDAKGDPWYSTFQSAKERDVAKAAFIKEHGTAAAQGQTIRELMDTKMTDISDSFMLDIQDKIGAAGLSVDQRNALQDEIYQMYLENLPDVSTRHSAQHRKNTLGFATDAMKALAFHMHHGASQLANMKEGRQMSAVLEELNAIKEMADGDFTDGSNSKRAEALEKIDTAQALVDDWENLSEPGVLEAMDEPAMLSLLQKYSSEDALTKFITGSKRIVAGSRLLVTDVEKQKAAEVIGELHSSYEAMVNTDSGPMDRAASQARQFGFIWMLGYGISTAVMNLLQTPIVAMPFVVGKYGVADTAAAFKANYGNFMRAVRMARKGEEGRDEDGNASISVVLEEKLAKLPMGSPAHEAILEQIHAMEDFKSSGQTSRTQTNDVISLSKNGDVEGGKLHELTQGMGWMFHHGERVNREVTLLSAFNLARTTPIDGVVMNYNEAMAYAIKVTNLGHGEYSPENAARIFRGWPAGVALQFGKYPQLMYYAYGSTFADTHNGWKKMPDGAAKEAAKQEAREAGRTLTALLIMQTAVAGTFGLPLTGALVVAINLIGSALDDDDDPWDTKREIRMALADIGGETFSTAMTKGLFNAFTPADLGGRLSVSNIKFQEQRKDLEGREAMSGILVSLFGPTGGLLQRVAEGAKLAGEGEYERAAEQLLPKFAGDPLKAIRFATQDARSISGKKLKTMSPAEVLMQTMGIGSSDLSTKYEDQSYEMSATKSISDTRTKLLHRAARAKTEKTAIPAQEIRDWNRKYPSRPIRPQDVDNSIRASVREEKKRGDKGYYVPDYVPDYSISEDD